MPLGKVWLVGAGPGDPGLITMAGLARLAEADVVVYDRLVDKRLLERAREGAELIDVGKMPGGRRQAQEEINALLVAKAREGKRVVRLKGGDPFIFGRGGEEAEALAEAGIPFAVVPGVTSAMAVPAYAGIPLTHRKLASSFTVVSGSEDPTKGGSSIDWRALATGAGTLVVLMGWDNLPNIVDALVKNGRSSSTPVALIHQGTGPRQRTVVGTLADIVAKGRDAGFAPPVVAVIGEVVALRQLIRWFDNKPLFGRRVLVTRARHQASALARLLAEEGAEVIELPTIEIVERVDNDTLEKAIARLAEGGYAWVIFTSANGVDIFFDHLRKAGRDARAFAAAKVCAIGPATAQALERRGIRADLVPQAYIAEGVLTALAGQIAPGEKVLLPRAQAARPELVEGLRSLGAQVDEVTLYVAAAPQAVDAETLARVKAGEVDIITLASSSTVRNLVRLLGGDIEPLKRALVACIGPVTAATARQHGFKVDIIAEEYTVPGLVRAILEYGG